MLTRIRNALMAGHTSVNIPSSKIKVAIAKILMDEGFIDGYRVTKDRLRPELQIRLKYVGERKDRHSVITQLKRVSRPGRRVYTRAANVEWVRSGVGIAIVSTPKGVLTGQQARRLGVGGEVLCYVW
jgi:small subunit ribosomal protein S8